MPDTIDRSPYEGEPDESGRRSGGGHVARCPASGRGEAGLVDRPFRPEHVDGVGDGGGLESFLIFQLVEFFQECFCFQVRQKPLFGFAGGV